MSYELLSLADEILEGIQQVRELIDAGSWLDALLAGAALNSTYVRLNHTKLYRSIASRHLASSRGGKASIDPRQQEKILVRAQGAVAEDPQLRIDKLSEIISDQPDIGRSKYAVRECLDLFKNTGELPDSLWARGRPSVR